MRYLRSAPTVLLFVAATSLVSAQSRSIVLERVIVRVNGEIFTQSELTRRQTEVLRERNQPVQNASDDAMVKLLGEVTPDVLVSAVDELLLMQRGREIGARFTDQEFNSAIDNIKKQNKLDDAGLKAALQQEGLTMDELRSNFERAYLIQATQSEEIFRRMTITEEEMRQYYNGHKDEFMTQDTVTLREIMVSADVGPNGNVSAEADAAAKAKIEAVRARALQGEDFVALVTEFSSAGTKANGGLIGPVNVADVNPTLRTNVIDKVAQGQISEPQRTARGYQIFKVDVRSPPALRPFEEVRRQIEQAIRAQRLGGETERLLTRLRAQAVIEWKDENLRQVYEKRLAERSSTPLGASR